MENLGLKTNIELAAELVELTGRVVVDAGCGSMIFSKQLAAAGAQVIAVDPDPIQAAKNRESVTLGIQFFETGADQLPVGDGEIDAVFFAYSLHHIPASTYPDLFHEIVRVLRRGGFLYVIEPTDCPLNEVMKLFHDETKVRADAQDALQQIAIENFEPLKSLTYHSIREFDSFEDFGNQFTAKTFNTSYSAEDVFHDRVRERFEELGRPDYKFQAPKTVWLGRKVD